VTGSSAAFPQLVAEIRRRGRLRPAPRTHSLRGRPRVLLDRRLNEYRWRLPL